MAMTLAAYANCQCLISNLEVPTGQWKGFGRALAIYGNDVVVGAPYADDGAASGSGRCVIYVLRDGVWTLRHELVNPEPANDCHFGKAVAIRNTWAFVAKDGFNGPASGKGAVYVYAGAAGTWQFAQKLADAASDSSAFGCALDATDEQLAVGEALTNSVHIYRRTVTGWQLVQTLKPTGAELGMPGAGFGTNVSFDGSTTLLVAAPYAGSGASQIGKVFYYHYSGIDWQQLGTLPYAPAPLDTFGTALDAHDGTVVVGAPNADPAGSNSGACHVFKSTGASGYALSASFALPQPQQFAALGHHVAATDSRVFAASNDFIGADARVYQVKSSGVWEETSHIDGPSVGVPCIGMAFAGSDKLFVASGECAAQMSNAAVFGANGTPDGFLSVEPLSQSLSHSTGLVRIWNTSKTVGTVYLVLVSLAGSEPGFDVNGVHIPINLDSIVQFCAANPKSTLVPNGYGQLNLNGYASTQLVVPSAAGLPMGTEVTATALFLSPSPVGPKLGCTNADKYVLAQ